MSVTVAEEGNKRRGEASTEEIQQCVIGETLQSDENDSSEFSDIKAWFQRSISIDFDRAGSSDFQRCEKALDLSFPLELRIILSEANGGLWIMDKKMMSCDDIIDAVSNLQRSSSIWRESYLPFAVAADNCSYLIIDVARGTEVFEFDLDGGVEKVSSSLSAYLETYRNSLLVGAHDFVAGLGVIENVPRSRK